VTNTVPNGVTTLAGAVAALALERPDATVFTTAEEHLTWSEYHQRSNAIAAGLVAAGHAPGERVAVMLPDGGTVHTAYLGIEKAGCVIVGIGPRAGAREVEHLLTKTGATAFFTNETGLPAGIGGLDGRARGPDEL
jgi:acyl-CoA synthetase